MRGGPEGCARAHSFWLSTMKQSESDVRRRAARTMEQWWAPHHAATHRISSGKGTTMSSPSLAPRADNSVVETHATSDATPPQYLVISVRADERGAGAAAAWAEQVGGAGAAALVSSDAQLEKRVDAVQRVLVLDPGMIAARRGFGVRATSRERLQLVSRLAGHADHVTWAATDAEATRWVRAATG
jgi:hypothetical protein